MPDDSQTQKDEWQRIWDARIAALTGILGKPADTVLHAVIPFQLGGAADVCRITAWGWLNGKSVPDFSLTLRLCHVFRVSVADFLGGRIPHELALRVTGELPIRSARRSPGNHDDVSVAQAMERFCRKRGARPPSVTEVAEHVGLSPRVLQKRFPAACRDIRKRWREFIQEQRDARHEELRQTIKEAALRARIARTKLRRCDLIRLLPKPGVMRSATTRALINQMLLDLQ